MLSNKIEKELNNQILLEAESSQSYLAMASWAENKGFVGTTNFLYKHSDEERIHMLKLVRYVNDRDGKAIIPALKKPSDSFDSVTKMFRTILEHERNVTQMINKLVALCLEEKDYTTHNFLQWYVSEQLEEESLVKMILDKLKLIGDDKGGLYLFDNDIERISAPKPLAGGGQ
ncbi:MAG: ferritin [Vicingaceae bacterium]